MGHKAADGSRRGGLRRGAGHRKHGLARWATIWMDDNFGYYEELEAIRRIRGGKEVEDIEEAIDEASEYVDRWEDIASMMGGTVFLDYCENLAWRVIEEGYSKLDELEAELAIALAEEALEDSIFGLLF